MAGGKRGAARIALRVAGHLRLIWAFLGLASRYWVSVYPLIRQELRQWRLRAGAVPDPGLRELAFEAQRGKRRNLEGAAAFAVLVPAARARGVVRALVGFQAAYDYVDVLSEQPSGDTIASGYRLHLTLIAALRPGSAARDPYAHHPAGRDGGYLQRFVEACGEALGALPSYGATAAHAVEGARRIAVYQGLNNWGQGGDHRAYARWAAEETPAYSGLRWWETGAAAGSSLSVFAAIASAAQDGLTAAEAERIDGAYFPWIGALHTLLDSLVDHPSDVLEGEHSLVGHYTSPEEAARRMQEIARRSIDDALSLEGGGAHAMILAAMSCFYLTAPEAKMAHSQLARDLVLEALGELAGPTLVVMRLRQLL